MTLECCPTCGRPLFENRAGVMLSPLKARIFDAIKRAGLDGIDGDELFAMIFADRKVTRATLRVHIWQINDALMGTDLEIRRNAISNYFLATSLSPNPD